MENNTFEWQMDKCDQGAPASTENPSGRPAIFVCNHCHGVLTKYIVTDDIVVELDYHQQTCQQAFQTDLASIHSDNEQSQATLVSSIANEQTIHDRKEMWVGLTRANSGQMSGIGQMVLHLIMERTQAEEYIHGMRIDRRAVLMLCWSMRLNINGGMQIPVGLSWVYAIWYQIYAMQQIEYYYRERMDMDNRAMSS